MQNLWIWLALAVALLSGTHDALTKKALQAHDVYTVAWLRQMVVVAILAPCLLLIPVPPLNETFFKAFLFALPFEVCAYLCYMKAIQSSPLSLTVPFLSLTPVCLMFIPYIILGEAVSLSGGFGILLIALGSYALNLHEIRGGLLAPIRAIQRKKAPSI
jgi:drug/metabolite transporter (DMT)-like permease